MQPAEPEQLRRSQLMMGTIIEIVAYGQDQNLLESAISAAFDEIARLEKRLSRYHEDSDVTRLSKSSTGGEVAPETAAVIALGLDVAKRSQGAFDMTLGRLKAVWGFDKEAPSVPDKNAITDALQGIGPQAISLDKNRVTKSSPQLMVDLGGVAKGYAVDQAIRVLKNHGITSGAVNAGGDMYLLGQHPERPWRIGIQHPRKQQGTVATVEIRDKAVVTSGDYERYFEQEGRRYHHIFDPATGMPARLCQSVTIIAESVALGDALATAVFVLGPQAGLKLLQHYPETEGLVIAADGTAYESPGWKGYRAKP